MSTSTKDKIQNLHVLMAKVDQAYHRVYDKPSRSYLLKIWKPVLQIFLPIYIIILVATLLYEYVLPLSQLDKIGIGLQITAIALALGALVIAMVEVLKERIEQIEQDHLLSVIEGFDSSDSPIIKGLIRMRIKSRTVDLQDIYKLDSTIFEVGAILRKLTG